MVRGHEVRLHREAEYAQTGVEVVRPDRRVPIGRTALQQLGAPDVVHEHVEVAVVVAHARGYPRHLFRLEMIGRDRDTGPAEVVDELGRLLDRLRPVVFGALCTRGAAGADDGGARLSERRRDPAPPAACRTRDERDLSAQRAGLRRPICHHPMLARQNRSMDPVFRATRLDELERLRDIERAAGVLFAEAGMPEVAAHEPDPAEVLARYVQAGRAWVVTLDDTPVGYGVVSVVDGNAHLEQLSVHPDAGRHGLGTRLLHHICAWAREQGYTAVTLSTFADLPWNAPFYAKHGFRVMTGAEIGPQLSSVRSEGTARGLDPERRVCMSAAVGG